ncbi:MAG: hypothetical protein AB8H79_08155, partial [Myxococcota bacterium]
MRRGLLALILAGCPTGAPSPTDPEASVVPLDPWYFGCDDISGECAFEADQRQLTLWTDFPEEVVLKVDGRVAETTEKSVDGGLQIKVVLADLPAVVSLEGPNPGQRWTRRVVAKPKLPTADEVDCDAPDVDPRPEAKAMTRVHCAWAATRVEDEEARAAASKRLPDELYGAAQALSAAGWETEAVRVQFQASFMIMHSGDSERAMEWAQQLDPRREGTRRWGRAMLIAQTARRLAHYRQSSQTVDEALAVVNRLSLPAHRRDDSKSMKATLAASIGDLNTAVDVYSELAVEHDETDPCDRALAVNRENLAWFELLRRRAKRPPKREVDPRALLLLAKNRFEQCGGSAEDRGSVLTNLAFESWSREAWAETLDTVSQLPATPDPLVRGWSAALSGRAHLRLGNFDAAFDDADRASKIAIDQDLPDIAVFALLTQAEVAIAQGDAK